MNLAVRIGYFTLANIMAFIILAFALYRTAVLQSARIAMLEKRIDKISEILTNQNNSFK